MKQYDVQIIGTYHSSCNVLNHRPITLSGISLPHSIYIYFHFALLTAAPEHVDVKGSVVEAMAKIQAG